MRTRTRGTPLSLAKQLTSEQKLYIWNDVKWIYSGTVKSYYKPNSSYPWSTYERTIDELHKGPPYKTGGPFDNVSVDGSSYKRMNLIDNVIGKVVNTKYVVSGYPILIYNPWTLPAAASGRITAINTYGENVLGSLDSHAQGHYMKLSPLKPRCDLGQFVAEFGDLPRMLRGSADFFRRLWQRQGGHRTAFKPNKLANEWLNNQFGWVPFIGTLTNLFTTMRDLEKTLDRLRRKNGEWETRKGRMKTVVNDNVGGTGAVSYHFPVDSRFATQFTYNVRRYATRDEWITAKFRYYIPDLARVKYPTRLIADILGLRISPQLMYDLIPWSWLADWFINVRDILERADDKTDYQLVTKDLYAMGRTVLTDTIDYKFKVTGNVSTDSCYGVASFPVLRQQRVQGTPFGFGVHSTDLSPWKVSILAALGLSMRNW